MRRYTLLVPLVLSLAIIAATHSTLLAQATRSTRPIRVVVTGGLTLPQGDLKKFHDSGIHADVSLLLSLFGLPLTLRPELSITRLKQQLPSVSGLLNPLTTAADSTQTTQFLGALGNIELPLAAGLYVLGGVGVLNLDNASKRETKMTVNAGAGLRFNLGPVAGFVEARLGTASYNGGAFGYTKAQFIPISFGLAF